MEQPTPPSGAAPYDPAFLNTRREAGLILGAWLFCLLWTVGYCWLAGYDVPPGEVTTVLGIPAWVFWGVFVPWIAATAFSVWFGLFYIADDDLGASAPEGIPDDPDA